MKFEKARRNGPEAFRVIQLCFRHFVNKFDQRTVHLLRVRCTQEMLAILDCDKVRVG